jgi:D-alanyl-D-alanine carboxypeptidase
MQKVLLWLLAASLLLGLRPFPQEEGAPELSADCAVLLGPEGQILFEKDAHRRCPIASTTKLMTALVTLEHAALSDTVEIPAACCGVEGSSMYLQAGESYTVEELLTGLLLASGNDAAEALALYCAGSEERFAVWMNEKAEELGMADTHFANPHGLDAEGHYSSAADLGLLMAACMERQELRTILSRGEALIQGKCYVNHNKLLWRCPGCLGGKTGYTRAAGRCLVSCCERDGARLYCVTLSAPDDWNDHMALYDWGYSRYVCANVTGALRYSLPLLGAGEGQIRLTADPLPLFLPKSAELQLQTELPPFVLPPVRAGETAGRVRVFWNGEELGSAALRFTESA